LERVKRKKWEGLTAKTINSAAAAAARGCRMDTKRFGAHSAGRLGSSYN
jgi:hypothetical protein